MGRLKRSHQKHTRREDGVKRSGEIFGQKASRGQGRSARATAKERPRSAGHRWGVGPVRREQPRPDADRRRIARATPVAFALVACTDVNGRLGETRLSRCRASSARPSIGAATKCRSRATDGAPSIGSRSSTSVLMGSQRKTGTGEHRGEYLWYTIPG